MFVPLRVYTTDQLRKECFQDWPLLPRVGQPSQAARLAVYATAQPCLRHCKHHRSWQRSLTKMVGLCYAGLTACMLCLVLACQVSLTSGMQTWQS